MASRNYPKAIQEQVRQRCNYLCEYCHASEQWQYVRFTIDHVIPIAQGGTDDIDNLALACFHCNRKKTNKISAIVPQSGVEVPLFNPRQDNWEQHFIWSSDSLLIISLSAIGQATVAALMLNRERIINIRAADREIGRHPPVDDPIQQS